MSFHNHLRSATAFSALMLFAFPASVAFADVSPESAAPGAAPSLVPVAAGGVAASTQQSASFDFGSVNQGVSTPIKHRFILKNKSGNAVVVSQLTPSCGCTTAVTAGGPTLPATVAAGGEFAVDVAVDPLRVYPGTVQKSVAVYVAGQTAPATTLIMTGTLVPAATFSPDILNFGDLVYGDNASLELTATIDKRMVASIAAVHFQSSSPDISAEVVSSTPFGASEQTVVYKVKVSQTPSLGLIAGTVSLEAATAGGRRFTIGMPVSVQGNVVGGFSSAPQSVTFADVPAGQAATQHVFLTGITPADAPKVKLFSDSPMIDLEIENPAQPTLAKVLRLNVTLSSKMPVGTLQAQAIITAPDGQRLVLPIQAFTVAAPAAAQ